MTTRFDPVRLVTLAATALLALSGPVDHCGGESQWSVANGGRMGQVMGEDVFWTPPPSCERTRPCSNEIAAGSRELVQRREKGADERRN